MMGNVDGMAGNLEELNFDKAFFEDEVREGFFVTTMMKRYWACQLKVLSIIDGICKRHNINWFADYGTLMGAVRHGGYIPWDDDLDICMLRSDYNSFMEAARKELPEGYVIMTVQDQEGYNEPIGRIVNSHEIDFSNEHLKEYFGCPYTVGVDIFQLDGVYEDESKLADQRKRASQIIDSYNTALAQGADSEKQKSLLVKLDRVYSECSDIGASKVAFMRFFLPDKHHVYDRKVFESYVELPFENICVRAPAMYGIKLGMDYGDYMHVFTGGGVHDYPVYSDQEQTLREYIGGNPFRYTLDNQKLLVSVGRYITKMTSRQEDKTHRKIVFLPCKIGWWPSMEDLWKRAAADPGAEVHVMPVPYYDRDFEGNITDLHSDKVLFPEYVHAEDPDNYDFDAERPDVVVIQVPYDDTCTFMMVHPRYHSDNLQKITDELVYIPCFEPDDPINDGDKASTALRLLVEQPAVVNADKVVIESEKMKEVYLKKLLELTGEPTRDYWDQKLVKSAELGWGKDTDEITEEAKTAKEGADRKTIVYYVSISFLLSGGSKAIDKIKKTLEIFEGNKDSLDVYLVPQRAVIEKLESIDREIWQGFCEVTDRLGAGNCIYDKDGASLEFIDRWDAFYGDPGVLARKCVLRGIPVMLQNIEV